MWLPPLAAAGVIKVIMTGQRIGSQQMAVTKLHRAARAM